MRQHDNCVQPEARPEALRQDTQRWELPAGPHGRVQPVDVNDEIRFEVVVRPAEGHRRFKLSGGRPRGKGRKAKEAKEGRRANTYT